MPEGPRSTQDVCRCGHEHTAGRVGSCSKFTCPCNRWHPPEEEGDRNVSPRPESAQPEDVAEGVAAGSPSSSGGPHTTPPSSLIAALFRLRLNLWRLAQRAHEATPNWPRRRRLSSYLANRHINAYFEWEKVAHRG